MAYTVISLYPESVDLDQVKKELENKGFDSNDINISKYTIEGETAEDYDEDETTAGFWDLLFGGTKYRDTYKKAASHNNTVTIYAENLEVARKAKIAMDELGAIDINKYHKDYIDEEYQISDEDEARIIAKAKHNVYFLDGTRTYKPNSRGKAHRMDYTGNNTPAN